MWGNKRLVRILNLPMVEWDVAISKLTEKDRYQLDTDAAALAQRAARLSAYVSTRAASGAHDVAVRHQNRVVKDVRRALGFAHPESNTLF